MTLAYFVESLWFCALQALSLILLSFLQTTHKAYVVQYIDKQADV